MAHKASDDDILREKLATIAGWTNIHWVHDRYHPGDNPAPSPPTLVGDPPGRHNTWTSSIPRYFDTDSNGLTLLRELEVKTVKKFGWPVYKRELQRAIRFLINGVMLTDIELNIGETHGVQFVEDEALYFADARQRALAIIECWK